MLAAPTRFGAGSNPATDVMEGTEMVSVKSAYNASEANKLNSVAQAFAAAIKAANKPVKSGI